MSNPEQPDQRVPSLLTPPSKIGGGVPLDLKKLTDNDEIAKMLNATRHLDFNEYEDFVNKGGERAALAVLRARAVEGDAKCLALYLQVCKEQRERRRLQGGEERGDLGSAAFVPQRRRRRDPRELPAAGSGGE